MKLQWFTPKLAQKIVDRTMKILGKNINVMDRNGVIIGSGDRSRIGHTHDGALLALKENRTIEIDEQSVNQLKGVKMGVNLPIHFLGETVGVIGITGDPNDIREYAELVKMAAEMVLQQSFFLEQVQWKQRLKEDLVNQLIYDDYVDESSFLERAKTFGVNLSLPRLVIVVEIPHEQIQYVNQQLLRTLTYELATEDLAAFTYSSEIVVLKSIVNEERDIGDIIGKMERILQKVTNGKAGIGPCCSKIPAIKQSYELAKQAVTVGRKMDPERYVYHYKEVEFEILLSEMGQLPLAGSAFEFYEQLLEHDETGELQETLHVYIQEKGELNKTASKLFVHRNTLRYRFEKIQKITGKDPHNIKDLLQLYTALIVHQLR